MLGEGAADKRDGYAPIADYAFIGDCHSTALVSSTGSIDWACMRRFDAGGVFCRLLDAGKGGSFDLQAENLVRAHRSYLEDSNVLETVVAAASKWQSPDQGLWEMRGPPQHFVHSKVMCWVALDRGIALAEREGLPADVASWRRVRDEIRETIELRGVDPDRGCFVQAFDSRELDASLLLLPMVGFDDANSARMQATTEHIQKELSDDGLLIRRYRAGHPDGLSRVEGDFLMVSFWMVQVLAMQGHWQAAKQRFARLLALGNDLQLFAEEYQPGEGFLGNYPQAFTHVAIIEAAQQIADAEARGAAGRCSWGDRAVQRKQAEVKTS